MPENKKINLSALLKQNSKPTDISAIEPTDVPEDIVAIKAIDNNTANQAEKEMVKPLDALKVEEKPSIIPLETEVKNIEKITPKTENQEDSWTKHALSLDRLKTRWRTEEEISDIAKKELEKAEIAKNLAAIDQQQKTESKDTVDEVEVFGNYESKFSTESKQILKRLRMPKTRIGMLLSLSLICLWVIWTLMIIDPKTHSIDNYKTSIRDIYSDIKSDKSEVTTIDTSKSLDQNIDNTIDTPPNNNIVNETIEIEEIEDIEERVAKKEEIKQENFKNFLRENFK